MRTNLLLAFLTLTISATGLQAQVPVQPAARPSGAAGNTAMTAPAASSDGEAAAKALLQTLLQLKASNDEILKRQTATLGQLDEVAKAAEQLKVYATRG